MTDAPLSFVSSADGASWSKPQNIVNGYSDYGLQMHNYRGELYGIMTQTVQYPKQLFATKYKISEGWKPFRSLPANFLSQGRASVTVLEDRFFILRRGTNDAVYLAWTDDFENFRDAGRVGSAYATTMVAPAICAHNGLLYLAGVGPDKYIYFTIVDKNGKRLQSWKKIDGTGTQSALSMAVFDGKLWLFHTGYNNDNVFYQSLDDDSKGAWSPIGRYSTNITSGISLSTWKYNRLALSFRGKDNDIKYMFFDGKVFSGKLYVPNETMKYQLGMSTWGGRLVISYAAAKSSSGGGLAGYRPRSLLMDEKSGVFSAVEEVSEWDCKWNQDGKDGQDGKSWVKKMFCL